MSAVSISVFSMFQAVCENVYQFLIKMVFVDGTACLSFGIGLGKGLC